MPQILIVVTNRRSMRDGNVVHPTGVWLDTFTWPYHLFRSIGAEVTIASPRGESVPVDPRSIPFFPGRIQEAAMMALWDALPLHAIQSAWDFDAIFFPAGYGALFDLPENPWLHDLLSDFVRQDKVIAAVSHGVAALAGAHLADGTPLVAGRVVTACTNAEEHRLRHLLPFMLESRLRALGAYVVTGPRGADHVECDQKLITGQNARSSVSVARAVIGMFQTRRLSRSGVKGHKRMPYKFPHLDDAKTIPG